MHIGLTFCLWDNYPGWNFFVTKLYYTIDVINSFIYIMIADAYNFELEIWCALYAYIRYKNKSSKGIFQSFDSSCHLLSVVEN